MSVRPGSNRIYLAATVLMFLLVGLAWRLMTRSTKEQIQRAQRNGVTVEGATPAPLAQTINTRITAQIELRQAVEHGQWALIERRLATGESLEQRIDGHTLLMIAAQHGQVDVIRGLCDRGSKVDARDAHGNTAAFYAARYGQAAALRLLLEHGADLHGQNDNELNLLDIAILGRQADVYAFLRDRGLKVNLRQAAQMNDVRSLDRLLQGGAQVNAVYPSVTPPPLDDYYPILTPADYRNIPSGTASGPGKGIPTPLRNGSKRFPGDDHDYRTALSGALEVGPSESAARLLAHGAAPDAKDDYGMTALMYAARSGNLEAVQFLLNHGAKTDVQGPGGTDALKQVNLLIAIRATANDQREPLQSNCKAIVALLQRNTGSR